MMDLALGLCALVVAWVAVGREKEQGVFLIACGTFVVAWFQRASHFASGFRTLHGYHHIPDFYGKFFDSNWGRLLWERPLDEGWLNVGYWEDRDTFGPPNLPGNGGDYGKACRTLLNMLLRCARLSPGDALLEVGFGQAVSTFIIAAHYQNLKIAAIDLTPEHVITAKAKLTQGALISFHLDSATEMKTVSDASQNVVLGLECAFHFDSREKFLGQVLRVLKPGGRIVLADIILSKGTKALRNASDWVPACKDFSETLSKSMGVPACNHVDVDGYKALLEELGFTEILVEDISAKTTVPFSSHALSRLAAVRENLDPAFRTYVEHMGGYLLPWCSSYVLVCATKRASSF
jgi:ubiquinone/menaquinone biosynthesis C-methylase UbiE